MAESTLTGRQNLTCTPTQNLWPPELSGLEASLIKHPQSANISFDLRLSIQEQWSLAQLKSALQDSLWYGDRFKTPSSVFVNGKLITAYSVKRSYLLNQLDQIENEIIGQVQQEEWEAAQKHPGTNFTGRWLMLRPGESTIAKLSCQESIPNLSFVNLFEAEQQRSSTRVMNMISATHCFSSITAEDQGQISVNLHNHSNDLHLLLHGSKISQGISEQLA